MARLAVFLINLDGSEARLRAATAGLRAAAIGFTRVPAFDGRTARVGDLPLYDEAGAIRDMGRPLLGGEVGCTLSHIEAARRFLAVEARYGLILEDDVAVQPDARQILERLLDALDAGAAVTPWEVANLGRAAHRLFTPLGAISGGRVLQRAHFFPVTATALLWTRAGAARFVQAATAITLPLDEWLRLSVSAADSGLAVTPPLFPAAALASDIDATGRRHARGQGWRVLRARHLRLWTSKLRAWRHKTSFRRPGR